MFEEPIKSPCPRCGHNFTKTLAELYADPQFDLICQCGASFGPDGTGVQTAIKRLLDEINKLSSQSPGKGIDFRKR